MDDGHRVMVCLVVHWEATAEDEERVSVSVEPRDLVHWAAGILSRALRENRKEREGGREREREKGREG